MSRKKLNKAKQSEKSTVNRARRHVIHTTWVVPTILTVSLPVHAETSDPSPTTTVAPTTTAEPTTTVAPTTTVEPTTTIAPTTTVAPTTTAAPVSSCSLQVTGSSTLNLFQGIGLQDGLVLFSFQATNTGETTLTLQGMNLESLDQTSAAVSNITSVGASVPPGSSVSFDMISPTSFINTIGTCLQGARDWNTVVNFTSDSKDKEIVSCSAGVTVICNAAPA